MSTPGVSVVIPMHNSSGTIERAIRSVLDQSLAVLEVVVVDDASDDDSCGLIERLAATSPIPITLIRLGANLGAGATRNEGWKVARGELIAFLDADDAWHPRKIETQVRAMAAHPGVVMSCHRHRFGFDEDWTEVVDASPRVLTLRSFLFKNRCSTPSVMLRNDIEERFGNGSHSEDYMLWMRIVARHGSCIRIDAPLVHCNNPAFGGRGLSGQLVLMEKSELANFRALRLDGVISSPTFVAVCTWSLIKFVLRIVRGALRLRRGQR